MSDRQQRVRANEDRFRAFNEAVAEIRESFDHHDLELVCECEDLACARRLRLDPERYAAIRRHDGRFVVLPDHEALDVEDVIEQDDGFHVVQKHPS
jgi:hypothetical protein